MRLEDPPTAIRPTGARRRARPAGAARCANREHTGPWDPVRDESFYTEAGQRLELDLDQRSWAAGSAYAFAILDTDARRPAHRPRRAVQRRARAVAERDARLLDRQGRARARATRRARCGSCCASPSSTPACTACSRRSSPATSRSVRVAEKAGFRLEGRALRYLKINGALGGPRRLRAHGRGLGGDGAGAEGRCLRCRRALPANAPAPPARHAGAARPRARDAAGPGRLRPAAVRRGGPRRPRADRRDARRRPAVDRRAPSPRPARPRALGIPAVLLFGIPAHKDEEGSGAWDDEGVVQLADARDQGRPPRPARHRRPVPVRVHEPRPLRPAARRRLGRQRRERRAARAHRASRRRAPAPTSSRPAT